MILLPTVWHRQPSQVARLDKSHPVIRNATVLFDARFGLVNRVNNEAFTNPFAMSSVPGAGVGASLTTVSSAVNVGCVVNTYPYIMFGVLTKPTGAGTNTFGLSNSSDLTPDRSMAQLNASGSVRRWSAIVDLNTDSAVASAEGIVDASTPICFVMVARSSTSRTIYSNGVQGQTDTASKTESYNKFNIGGYQGLIGWSANNITGLMLAGVVEGLHMTDAEAIAFSATPWQIFASVNRHAVLQFESGYASELEDDVSAVTAWSSSAVTSIPTAADADAVTSASISVVTSIPLSASNSAVTAAPSAFGIDLSTIVSAVTDTSASVSTSIPLLAYEDADTSESVAIMTVDLMGSVGYAITDTSASVVTSIPLSASNSAITATPSALGIDLSVAADAVTGESASVSTSIPLYVYV